VIGRVSWSCEHYQPRHSRREPAAPDPQLAVNNKADLNISGAARKVDLSLW
jgi:hypothetical protein